MEYQKNRLKDRLDRLTQSDWAYNVFVQNVLGLFLLFV